MKPPCPRRFLAVFSSPLIPRVDTSTAPFNPGHKHQASPKVVDSQYPRQNSNMPNPMTAIRRWWERISVFLNGPYFDERFKTRVHYLQLSLAILVIILTGARLGTKPDYIPVSRADTLGIVTVRLTPAPFSRTELDQLTMNPLPRASNPSSSSATSSSRRMYGDASGGPAPRPTWSSTASSCPFGSSSSSSC